MNMNEMSFIDLVSLNSFCVGLQNLDLNVSQENLDNQTQELDKRLRSVVDDIHQHLEMQDKKIEQILEELRHEG